MCTGLFVCGIHTNLPLKKETDFRFRIAFIIASAIPQIQAITALVAAIPTVQFTYSFPPLLRFGYDVITDAMAADQPYVPGNGSAGRIDTWQQWSRWKRVR